MRSIRQQVYKNAKKREELGQYPAILTSRLVNSTDEHISNPLGHRNVKVVPESLSRAG